MNQTSPFTHHLIVSWLVLAMLQLFVPSAMAQDATPAEAPESTPAPEAIATADIPERADADASFAQDVIERSQRDDSVASLQPRLDTLTQTVFRQRTQFKRDVLRQLPVVRLESLDRQWHFMAQQLSDWRALLEQRTSPYLEDAERLGRRKAEWRATRTAAEVEGVPTALLDRMTSVQSQLDQAEQAISMPIDALITLRRRAARVAANIEAAQKEVTNAIAYSDGRLAKIDAPALWAMRDRAPESIASATEAGLQIESDFMREYGQAKRGALRVYSFVSAALLVLLVWLSFKVRKLAADDPRTRASIRVLRRPVSAWLLMVMTGVLLFEVDAPIFLHQFAYFVMIVPLLRLLPARVYELLGPWPYVVSALYLLNLLSIFFLSNSFFRRLYFLGLALVAAALLIWFLVRRHPAAQSSAPDHEPSVSMKLLRMAGGLAVISLSISVGANVFGNVSLAEMLTEALLTSAYIALVFFAGVHVFSSLAHLILTKTGLRRLHIVEQHGASMLRGFTRVLQLVALVGWMIVMLSQFRIYRPIYQAIVDALTHPFQLGEISMTLGGALTFILSVLAAIWLSKTVRFVLRDEVLPNMSLPRGVANSVSSLTYYFLIIGGLAVALVASGFEVSQLAFALGALGVGIGLGLQDVVRNFVSGLILMFERPIQPGDVIEVGGTGGKVRDIGMRATTLATFDGAEVVVPNGMLLSEKLTNWTLSDMNRRFEINFGVAYGTDPKRVLDLVMETTRATPGIATDPEPMVLFSGMGASSLDFMLRAWTNNFGDWVKTRSDLTVRVHDAIVAAGIEIPFPQQDLHLRSVSSDATASLSKMVAPNQSKP